MKQVVPLWLTILVSAMGIVVTLFGDRVAMGATVASVEVRVSVLEKQHEEMNARYMKMLQDIGEKLDRNGLAIQTIVDRQDEVRRKLRIQ